MIFINPTTPIEDIHLLMQTGDLWDRFTNCEHDYSEFQSSHIVCTLKQEWYGIHKDKELIGALWCELVNHDTLLLHMYISKPHRKDVAQVVESIYTFLTWFRPEIKTLMVKAPDCFPEVMKCATKSGFELVGYVDDNYMKHGKHHKVNFYVNNNWRVI